MLFLNDYIYILPEVSFLIFIFILLSYGILTYKYNKKYYLNIYNVTFLSIFVIIGLLFLYVYQFISYNIIFTIFDYQLISNSFIYLIKILILISTLIFLIFAYYFFNSEGIRSFEFIILILLVSFALTILISSNNLIIMYLALELQSLSLYILCSYKQNTNSSIESGLKFFITGSVGSGFLLFGASIIYGVLGTLSFNEIQSMFIDHFYENDLILTIGLLLLLVGLFFKLAIAPFHVWLMDVYEGASTLVVAYIAVIPKIAVIGLLARLLYTVFIVNSFYISYLLLIVSIISILIGILGAYFQKKIRSLIAYSSIANMGYLVLLISNIIDLPEESLYFSIYLYLLIYMLNMFSIFIIIMLLRHWSTKKSLIYIYELSGLGKRYKGLAIILSFNLFSLIGIPPLAGFFSKFYISLLLVSSKLVLLTFIFLLLGVLSSIYYLRLIKLLFFDKVNMSLFIKKIKPSISCLLISLIFFQLFLFIKPSILFLLYDFLNL